MPWGATAWAGPAGVVTSASRRSPRSSSRRSSLPSAGEVKASDTVSTGWPSAPRRRAGGSSTATSGRAAAAGGGAWSTAAGWVAGCWGSICSVTRSGVTSCTFSFSVAPACTSGGTWAVTGMPARTMTACCSPREATRAISVAPSRSGMSGNWARSSAAATAIGSTISGHSRAGPQLKDGDSTADVGAHMDRGLYIAASGMLAEQVRQDQIANDLANASTPGYKADRTTQRSFGALLLNTSVTGARVGSQSTAVQVDTITTDFTPEPLKDTGEPLDFGITGDGFFALQTAQGTRYTRNGQFTTNAQGQLTDATGNRVLGRDGNPLTVGADGRVDPRRLNVVLLQNPRKLGDNLVSGTPGNVAGQAAGQVRSGALEGSGADPTQSMVDMMASMRAYESGQKVIQTIDETLGKAASSVGALNG